MLPVVRQTLSSRQLADFQLHNSHLASRSLPYAQRADLSIPYLLRPTRESLDSAVNTWAQLCGAEVVSDVTDAQSGKTVVLLEVSKDHGKVQYSSEGIQTDSQTYLQFQYPIPPT
jgi:hypothetical protein